MEEPHPEQQFQVQQFTPTENLASTHLYYWLDNLSEQLLSEFKIKFLATQLDKQSCSSLNIIRNTHKTNSV